MAHIMDKFSLVSGAQVTEEFESLRTSGVSPIIRGGTTLDQLVENNLLPQQKIEFHDATYYLSRVFGVKASSDQFESTPAFIYYVARTAKPKGKKKKGKKEIFVNVAYRRYRSNEWGVISDVTSPKKSFYLGNIGELATGLPLEILGLIDSLYNEQQSSLTLIDRELFLGIPAQNNPGNDNEVIDQIARKYNLNDPSIKLTTRDRISKDAEQVEATAAGLPAVIGAFRSNHPSSFEFARGYEPDLAKLVTTRNIENPFYKGEVYTYNFLSANGKLMYCFHLDQEGRPWLGAVQSMTPEVTSFGVSKVRLRFGQLFRAERINYGDGSVVNDIRIMDIFTPGFKGGGHLFEEFMGAHHPTNPSYHDASSFTLAIPSFSVFRDRAMAGSLLYMDVQFREPGQAPTKKETPPQAVAGPDRTQSPEPTESRLLDQAKSLAKGGSHEPAIIFYKQYIGENPTNPEAHFHLARSLSALKKPEEAEQAYQTAIELDPTNTSAMNNRAWSLYKRKQYEPAMEQYAILLEVKPDHKLANTNLEKVVDKCTEAAKKLPLRKRNPAYVTIAHCAPKNAAAQNRAGWTFYQLKDYAQAVEFLEKAVELKPKSPTYKRNLAKAKSKLAEGK
jgi:Flp pilus assembly protein TadD